MSVSLKQFYSMLEQHDWDYQYSDDPSEYRKGVDSFSLLRRISSQSEDHKALFSAFSSYKEGKEDKPMIGE